MSKHDQGSARIHDPNKNRWFELTFYGLCGLILLFLILPLFVVIPISFSSASFLQFPPTEFSLKWYRNFFVRNCSILTMRRMIATDKQHSVPFAHGVHNSAHILIRNVRGNA